MTYDLRRLRLRGIIERIPRTQRSIGSTAEGCACALATTTSATERATFMVATPVDGLLTGQFAATIASGRP